MSFLFKANVAFFTYGLISIWALGDKSTLAFITLFINGIAIASYLTAPERK